MAAVVGRLAAQTFRNRSAFTSGLVVPAPLSALVVWRHQVFDGAGHGHVAAVVVFTIAGFGLYAGIVSALVARRQDLFPSRMRSTAEVNASILVELVLSAAAMAMVQLVAVLLMLGAVAGPPGSPGTFVGATLLVLSMMGALGLATAGVTRSSERAWITTLPVAVGTLAVAHWVGVTDTQELTAVKRALPGGAAAELVVSAWDGSVMAADVPLMVGLTLAWVLAPALLASRYFTWQPRR